MYLEFNSSWNDDRPEWQRMRADGSHHDGRYTRVNHGCTGSNSISSWSGGSRNNQPITLHRCYVFAIKIEVDIGQVGRRSAIDHHFIEDKQAQWSFSSFTGRFVFTHNDATQTASQCQCCVTCPNKSNIISRSNWAIPHLSEQITYFKNNHINTTGTLKKIYPSRKFRRILLYVRFKIIKCTFKHVGHLFFKVMELEGRQEAEAAKMKGHNRRHWLLESQTNQPNKTRHVNI